MGDGRVKSDETYLCNRVQFRQCGCKHCFLIKFFIITNVLFSILRIGIVVIISRIIAGTASYLENFEVF